MKYQVETLKCKHIDSINKDVINAELKEIGGNGAIERDVQIWQGFPNFETITFGSVVEGEIHSKTKGNYTNKTLYAIDTKQATTGNSGPSRGGFKANMAAIVEKKAENIEKAQTRRETSIELSGTARDATILTQTLVANNPEPVTMEQMQSIWLKWRAWLLGQYGDPKDPTEVPPFN